MFANDVHKQAAKAALARLVVQGGDSRIVVLAVAEASVTLGLQLGDLSSYAALQKYADGVAAKGERVSNRKWSSYSQSVRIVVDQIARQGRLELQALSL